MTTRTETRIDEIATLIQIWKQTDESAHALAQRIVDFMKSYDSNSGGKSNS